MTAHRCANCFPPAIHRKASGLAEALHMIERSREVRVCTAVGAFPIARGEAIAQLARLEPSQQARIPLAVSWHHDGEGWTCIV